MITTVRPAQYGVNFNKLSEYIDCGTIFDNLAPFTIAGWYYPRSNGQSTFGELFAKGGTTGARWSLFHPATNGLDMRVGYASSDLIRITSTTLTMNQWTHVLMTWTGDNGAANVHIYYNGVEASYSTTTDGTGGRSNDAGKSFGFGNNVAGSLALDAILTEVSVWNSVLSAGEITRLAKNPIRGLPLSISPSALIGYWPLDDIRDGNSGHSRTFYDLSKSKYHATGNRGTSTLLPKKIDTLFTGYSPMYLERKSAFQPVRFPRNKYFINRVATSSSQAAQRMMMGMGT